MTPDPVWLTYPQAARRARVTVRQVRRWRSSGLVTGRIDDRGRWLVDERELMAAARHAAFLRSRFSTTVQPSRRRGH